MKLIEIEALNNGAHRNQASEADIEIMPGWAVIPEEIEIPNTFPFVNIEVENGVVTSMTAGVVPEPDPELEDEPTQLDVIEAQVTYTAMMTGTLLTEGE